MLLPIFVLYDVQSLTNVIYDTLLELSVYLLFKTIIELFKTRLHNTYSLEMCKLKSSHTFMSVLGKRGPGVMKKKIQN